jgi:hypothetical protein
VTPAADHAMAFDLLTEAGTDVTFSLTTRTHDAATDTWTAPSTTTVTGKAVRVGASREDQRLRGRHARDLHERRRPHRVPPHPPHRVLRRRGTDHDLPEEHAVTTAPGTGAWLAGLAP